MFIGLAPPRIPEVDPKFSHDASMNIVTGEVIQPSQRLTA